jgi:thiamine biosynthesis protein ThiS
MSSRLHINGKEKTFDGVIPETVSALLSELKIDEATVVAEINGHIVERKDFGSMHLNDGAKIELIRFVGGG